MTVFARSDVMSVTQPETGETFNRKSKDVFPIDSDPEHEALLLARFPDQYSRLREGVPPTADELAEMGPHEQSAALVARERAAAASLELGHSRCRVNRAFWRAP